MTAVRIGRAAVLGTTVNVFVRFAATFKEFPPRSFPPSFNPATVMEETLDDLRDAQKQGAQKPK